MMLFVNINGSLNGVFGSISRLIRYFRVFCLIADICSNYFLIQDLLKLERLQEELAERYGNEPTFAQWAAAAGVNQRTLRKRLNYGTFCKDKMIKSNIRLVISIAKNYQGAGMNLQDLVQVLFHCCTPAELIVNGN